MRAHLREGGEVSGPPHRQRSSTGAAAGELASRQMHPALGQGAEVGQRPGGGHDDQGQVAGPAAPKPGDASHRPDRPVSGRARMLRGRRLVTAGIVGLLVAAAIIVWATSGGHGSRASTRSGSGPMSDTKNPVLLALTGANESSTAKGLIPASSCKAMTSTMVACTRPSFGIETATFSTFPSLNALYAAYVRHVDSVEPGPFRANFGDCSEVLTKGEVSWNHNYEHSRLYSLDLSRSGRLSDDKAAGRASCAFANGELHMLWTQNDGRLLGELTGAPHPDAYRWWHAVHHVIVLPHTQPPMTTSGGHM